MIELRRFQCQDPWAVGSFEWLVCDPWDLGGDAHSPLEGGMN